MHAVVEEARYEAVEEDTLEKDATAVVENAI
jgi:hypothetical protein